MSHVPGAGPEGVVLPVGPRPYPPLRSHDELALAATRALLRATDEQEVRRVVLTAVLDLGGVLVPARLDPADALPFDVSLGTGEPVVVVVDPSSVPALQLGRLLPELLDDARAVLARLGPARVVTDDDGDRRAGPGDLALYLGLLDAGDTAGAVSLVRALLQGGVTSSSVVGDVLVPAMREVGERWYTGAWSVADEHAATALTERCLHLLPEPSDGPAVVFAAPEGEWHALPGRLAAAAAPDVRGTVLGPGLPAEALQRYLDDVRPDAVGVTCTMSTQLVRVADTVRAVHAVGLPVVAGGRAFGGQPRRALRLGADAWCDDPDRLAETVVTNRGLADDVDLPRDAMLADAVGDDYLVLALERHAAASDWVRQMTARQRLHTLDDLRWLTRHAAAALACDDDAVLVDLLTWLDPLLRSRGVPARVLPDGVRYLADALDPEVPDVAGVLRAGAAALSRGG